MSAVEMRKLAAATAFARDVSGVKNPVPSPRAESTRRPASSTTVIVIGDPSCLALSWAAFTARSAMASVMSTMSSFLPDLAPSASLELGRALFHEGTDALASVRRVDADVLRERLELERFLEPRRLVVVERAPGQANGDGWTRCDFLSQAVRGRQQVLGRIHRAHDAEAERFLRVDDVTREDQLGSLGHADDAWQEVRAAPVGMEAALDEGLAEFRRRRRETDVAREREIHAG